MKKLLKNIYPAVLLCTFTLLLCVGGAFAQKKDECPDKEKKKAPTVVKKNRNKNKNYRVNRIQNRNVKIAPNFVLEVPSPPPPKVRPTFKGDSAEKSIKVNKKVNISFCVSKGKIKINGWNRNEIRAFVDGSKQIGLKVVEKNKDNKKPVWVKVLGYDPAKTGGFRRNECISGKVIELDVPFGSTINAKGGVGATTIDSVSKVKLKNIGGDVLLENIKYGINAINFEGNIVVKKSGGSIALETTTGNIVAIQASPSDWGDTFRAKTNSGAIVLQDVEFRQTEVYSNSGSIQYVGKVLNDSQSEFTTIDGSITLQIPKNTNADIIANYGGSFRSKLPLEDIIKGGNSTFRSLTGRLGRGGAKLIFKTYKGTILIDKLATP